MNNNALKEIEDIFNIPQDGSNLETASLSSDETHDSTYASAIGEGDAVSFDEKARSVKSEISSLIKDENIQIEYKDEDQDDDEAKMESVNVQQPKSSLDDIIKESIQAKNVEGSTSSSLGSKQSLVDKHDDSKRIQKSKDEILEYSEPQINLEQESSKTAPKQKTIIREDSFWSLKTDDMRFISFYEEKSDILPRLLIGGELPFDSMESTLLKAKVDINDISIYDLDLLSKKMHEIQEWRNRVTEINIRSAQQYYIWKRFIELIRGKLVRIYDVKPAQARDGLVYEHMRDFEFYYERLQALHESSKSIVKNLDASFEYCSRLVTLSLPQKNINRYEQKDLDFSQEKEVIESKNSNKYEEFDGIGDINSSKPKKIKENKTDPILGDDSWDF